MVTKRIVIDAEEIHEIYNWYFEDAPEYVNDDNFEEFLKFLEIDFYDWIRSNLRYFEPKEVIQQN